MNMSTEGIVFSASKGYLLIDTETNKLPDYNRSADAENQARLAEVAFIYLDTGFQVEREYQRYIRPDGWMMEPGATEVNGLTDDMLRAEGVDVAEVLNAYERAIEGEERPVIAFGAQFDCKLLRGELRRAGRDDMFEKTPSVCLMRSARPFAKQIGRELIKAGASNKGWPKLSDLCRFLDVTQDGEHDGLSDARSTLACLQKMVALGFEVRPEIHRSKNLEAIRSAS